MIKKLNPNLHTTDWISGIVKPFRIGIYQRKTDQIGLDVAYAFWNGTFWGMFGYNIETALELKHVKSYSDNLFWRGLLNKNDLS